MSVKVTCDMCGQELTKYNFGYFGSFSLYPPNADFKTKQQAVKISEDTYKFVPLDELPEPMYLCVDCMDDIQTFMKTLGVKKEQILGRKKHG